LQSIAQPTHIVRVLGGNVSRPTPDERNEESLLMPKVAKKKAKKVAKKKVKKSKKKAKK
jgi:hypothetical protein